MFIFRRALCYRHTHPPSRPQPSRNHPDMFHITTSLSNQRANLSRPFPPRLVSRTSNRHAANVQQLELTLCQRSCLIIFNRGPCERWAECQTRELPFRKVRGLSSGVQQDVTLAQTASCVKY